MAFFFEIHGADWRSLKYFFKIDSLTIYLTIRDDLNRISVKVKIRLGKEGEFIYTYICLFFFVYFCLFLTDKRQNG